MRKNISFTIIVYVISLFLSPLVYPQQQILLKNGDAIQGTVIAENQNISLYLAETYLLQSKMYFLILDLKKAQRSLIQARDICEKYGFNRLAIRVSSEQEE